MTPSLKRLKIVEAFINDTLHSIAESYKNKPRKLHPDTIKMIREVTATMRDVEELRKMLPEEPDAQLAAIDTDSLITGLDESK